MHMLHAWHLEHGTELPRPAANERHGPASRGSSGQLKGCRYVVKAPSRARVAPTAFSVSAEQSGSGVPRAQPKPGELSGSRTEHHQFSYISGIETTRLEATSLRTLHRCHLPSSNRSRVAVGKATPLEHWNTKKTQTSAAAKQMRQGRPTKGMQTVINQHGIGCHQTICGTLRLMFYISKNIYMALVEYPHHSVTCRPSFRQRRNQVSLAGGIGLPACVAELDG